MQNSRSLLNLIKVVKNHPKLFDSSTQNDEQDDFREWAAVAEECKITVSEAQDQWNQLLIEYVEYLRSDQKFDLAPHLDFLQPYFFTIKDDDVIDEGELLNAVETKRNEEIANLNINHTKIEDLDKNPLALQNNINTEQTTFNKTKSTKCNQQVPSILTGSNSQSGAFTNLSSLELIFLGYAKQLQKMPLALQLKIKRKIADIMDEAELQMIS